MSGFDPRLLVITDKALARPRSVCDVIEAALRGGARSVQLRDKDATARELFEQALLLLPIVRRFDAVLLINDRVDVAIAAGADGAHVGPGDLPVAAARRIVPASFILGFSTDDPDVARRAQAEGASYIGCGAVFGTTSKDVGGERIGAARLDEVAAAVTIPVIGIGGIGSHNVAAIAATRAAGVAVIGAIMSAEDPEAAALAMLSHFTTRTEA